MIGEIVSQAKEQIDNDLCTYTAEPANLWKDRHENSPFGRELNKWEGWTEASN